MSSIKVVNNSFTSLKELGLNFNYINIIQPYNLKIIKSKKINKKIIKNNVGFVKEIPKIKLNQKLEKS